MRRGTSSALSTGAYGLICWHLAIELARDRSGVQGMVYRAGNGGGGTALSEPHNYQAHIFCAVIEYWQETIRSHSAKSGDHTPCGKKPYLT